jgi:hypothetical protein
MTARRRGGPDRERRALVLAGGDLIGMFYEIGVLAVP